MLRCRLLCVDSPGALPPRSISLSSSVLRLPTHTNTHTDAYAVPLSPLLSCAQGIALCIMVKSHYICAGRLVRILRGPRQDRVGVIVDIVDANRVLVENPEDAKMWRHVQNLKNVEPLKYCVSVSRNCSAKALKDALASSKALEKYAKTRTAARVEAKKACAASTDFERYQLRVARRSRAHWARKVFDEKDAKTPVSWHKVALKKMQKKAAKMDSTEGAKRRMQKAIAARKAKK
ncbi:putative 40S ribosomal protein L14 [Leishmania infantum JPCM5]|nr:putative 40S ribosomal protein L14 [Leishmania infantum JPCM5]XP_001465656.1 putative 40S ribosomal protein L14 [Leishmania infantum JPCM5]XP_003860883.1 40S ribosomal protein L14, putative [Leishmania donovani]3JCS_K Chain K, ribosomal protein L14e [Leishmania donovani]CAM68077.1 putative 40S ribosomal protein L14 [Leishmania infantum JPCM5]CAM68081.1 putative 40S ribosomal protein L14 [Leishmania infantum JPCM5]CBZ34178.1 40S ribosomal protein L14, putative [Leishmania donovani]|eukprot:XP_001465652.1 putative 40S ribosomal protein L14 [Leishmania infantum JPCM5]